MTYRTTAYTYTFIYGERAEKRKKYKMLIRHKTNETQITRLRRKIICILSSVFALLNKDCLKTIELVVHTYVYIVWTYLIQKLDKINGNYAKPRL